MTILETIRAEERRLEKRLGQVERELDRFETERHVRPGHLVGAGLRPMKISLRAIVGSLPGSDQF